jgi:hypothetical protein
MCEPVSYIFFVNCIFFKHTQNVSSSINYGNRCCGILGLELSVQVVGMLIRLHDLPSEINVIFLEYSCASSYFSSTSSSTVTCCVLDGRCWVQFPAGIPPTLDKPPNQGISGTLFPVVQQLGHEADWSPSYGAYV